MAAYVADSEEKSKPENKNDEVELARTRIIKQTSKTTEKNGFKAILDLVKSEKSLIKSAIGSQLLTQNQISMVNDAIYLTKYNGFNYRIQYTNTDYDDDLERLQIGM